jgi:maltose alpha-D-glucosyltransferase/alpha-amylase
MERVIRTRKEWPALGWGETRLLGARDDALLAIASAWEDTAVLAVHNFAADPRTASIRLPDRLKGRRWQHLLGTTAGPPPDAPSDRASFELPAYGCHWFGSSDAARR